MSGPEVTIACVANVYVRTMHFKRAGDCEKGERHAFDHLTLLSAGKLRVETTDDTKDYEAPCLIFIAAEKYHRLSALADNTIAACIHALREGLRVEDILPFDPNRQPKNIFPLTVP